MNCTFCNKQLIRADAILCDGVIGFLHHVSENTVITCDSLMCRLCATKIGFTHYHSDLGKSICDTIDLCPVCIEKKRGQLNVVINAESAKREHLALINRKLFMVVNK